MVRTTECANYGTAAFSSYRCLPSVNADRCVGRQTFFAALPSVEGRLRRSGAARVPPRQLQLLERRLQTAGSRARRRAVRLSYVVHRVSEGEGREVSESGSCRLARGHCCGIAAAF